MASELLQDYALYQISCAVMTTANSVTSTAGSDGGGGESSIFDVVRRKISRVQDVIQGFAAPLKRRSMYEELPEHVWPKPEQIEMSRLQEQRRGRGHMFRPCQLSNPTWCDYCGDFIWGLFKQCQRCEHCHLTSHEHCVPLVNLNCITVPEDGGSPGSNLPSPSDPKASLETSLSLQTRPGCAKNVSCSSSNVAAGTSSSGQQPCRVSESAPDLQEISRRQSLPDCHDHHFGQQNSIGSDSNPSTATSGYFSQGRHSSSPCLPGLPPPPSAIDELTQGNDDARFITASHGQHHHSPPPSSHPAAQSSISNTQTKSPLPTASIPPIIEESSFTVTHSAPSQTVPAQITPVSPAPTATSVLSGDTSQPPLSVKPEGEASAEEKDETDSGYRSGTIPDEKLPKVPSQDTLDRQELKRKIAKYNHFVPAACLEMTGKDSFQGFIKVTMNLIRPITMELGARPPSIYELLTREHIIEENTQQVAFYMPRDTHKSLHITSETTTKDVVSSLLKKFHILDHPRKFAMYEQEFSDKNKLVRLRRLTDKNNPLVASLAWDPERIKNYRMVLQENETGEIVWEAFSLPELGNFLKVLDREERETILELRHKYAYMKQIIDKRLVEFKSGKHQVKKKTSNA